MALNPADLEIVKATTCGMCGEVRNVARKKEKPGSFSWRREPAVCVQCALLILTALIAKQISRAPRKKARKKPAA